MREAVPRDIRGFYPAFYLRTACKDIARREPDLGRELLSGGISNLGVNPAVQPLRILGYRPLTVTMRRDSYRPNDRRLITIHALN